MPACASSGSRRRTVTWVVDEAGVWSRRWTSWPKRCLTLSRPKPGVTRVDRAITRGPFATPESERAIARTLGAQLIGLHGLAAACRLRVVAAGRAVRLAERTAGPGAVGSPCDARRRRPSSHGARRRADGGAAEHRPLAARTRRAGTDRRDEPPLLVLDPRVPGQRPDSRAGLGARQAVVETRRWPRHFAELMQRTGGAARRVGIRSSCSGAPTPTAPGWRTCWRSGRAGCSTSATRPLRTAMSATPTGRRFIWPTTAR